jgi:hypothetical protein
MIGGAGEDIKACCDCGIPNLPRGVEAGIARIRECGAAEHRFLIDYGNIRSGNIGFDVLIK